MGSRGRERKSPGHLPSDLSKVGKYTIIGDQCLNPALSTHGNYPGIGLEGARVWDTDSQKDPWQALGSELSPVALEEDQSRGNAPTWQVPTEL